MGGDFQLAPNLNATVRLPESFRLRGTYNATKTVENGYQGHADVLSVGNGQHSIHTQGVGTPPPHAAL